MTIEDRVRGVVLEIDKLLRTCLPDNECAITYLTIFSQSEDDYLQLNKQLSKLGKKEAANNGAKYELNRPMKVENREISLIRVRKPDVHRKEYGCADIEVTGMTYDNLKGLALEKGWDIIQRKSFEMIELSTFDINTYAYIMNYQ